MYSIYIVKDATELEVIEEEPTTTYKQHETKKKSCCTTIKVNIILIRFVLLFILFVLVYS